MPDQEAADPLLRHRGEVLAALFAGPTFGAAAGPDGTGADPESAGGEPDLGSDLGAADRAGPPRGARSSPGQRRSTSGGGATASERIQALLSGDTRSAGESQLTQQFAELSAERLRSEPETEDTGTANAQPTPPPASAPASRRESLVATIRKPQVALLIGGVLVLVLVLVLLLPGGGKPAGSVAYITPSAQAPGPSGPPPPTTTSNGTLTVKSAQSHCPAGSTPGMDAFAGPGKAWTCVRAFKVDGQVLTIDLGHTYKISSISIVPGWDSVSAGGVDQWTKYRTVSRVSYQFNDSNVTTYTQQTMDQRGAVVTPVSPPISASRIVLTILASKGDPTINTTALSSIVITGQ